MYIRKELVSIVVYFHMAWWCLYRVGESVHTSSLQSKEHIVKKDVLSKNLMLIMWKIWLSASVTDTNELEIYSRVYLSSHPSLNRYRVRKLFRRCVGELFIGWSRDMRCDNVNHFSPVLDNLVPWWWQEPLKNLKLINTAISNLNAKDILDSVFLSN